MRTQDLVEPCALKPLLENQVLALGDHRDRLDQRPAVGLDREVLQRLPGLRTDCERALAACTSSPRYRSIGISSRWGSVNRQLEDPRQARESPPSLLPSPSRLGWQTLPPYDAYPPRYSSWRTTPTGWPGASAASGRATTSSRSRIPTSCTHAAHGSRATGCSGTISRTAANSSSKSSRRRHSIP